MTHQLFHLPRPTAISSNLTLVAGAKVGFFLTGTSTPTNTYQDSALTTPHTNPVVADSAGRLPAIYLNPSIVYRVTFTDASDVEIYPTIDPANDQVLSQAIIDVYFSQAISNGLLYPRTTTEIAEGVTPSNYAIPSHDAIGHVLPQRYNVVGDGTTNDYAAMVIADGVAAAAGATLVLGDGTYALNTSLAFSVPVVMEGGVIAGSGTVSFPAGFSAPDYYCFDCLVGEIRAETVHAEWFGARRSTATPTSTSVSITSKVWNTWPAWVTGATFGTDPGHDYGDTAYLAANTPFVNGDTWDHIATQRALWSIGQVTTGKRGEVRLLGGQYYFNKAVRYTGEMASTLSGAGKTKTLIDSPDWDDQGTVGVDVGTARGLLHFYRSGPDPTIVEGVGFTGPSGYVYGGSPPIYHVTHIGANGVLHRNQWMTTADAGWYFGSSCSDCTIEDFHSEYCRRTAYGYDALSWATIRNGAFWESGAGAQAVDFLRYVFMKACELIGYTLEPIVCGEGSHLSGITLIQDATDYKTHIDGNVIKRRVRVLAGATGTLLTVQMPVNSAVRTRMVIGGVVQGQGPAGIERTLTWYRDTVAPVAAGSAATEWGAAGAIALVAEGTSTTAGGTFSLTLVNSGTGSELYDAWVTVEIEGSDCVLQGLT